VSRMMSLTFMIENLCGAVTFSRSAVFDDCRLSVVFDGFTKRMFRLLAFVLFGSSDGRPEQLARVLRNVSLMSTRFNASDFFLIFLLNNGCVSRCRYNTVFRFLSRFLTHLTATSCAVSTPVDLK